LIALPMLAACATGPATLDATLLAAAGAGTLEVIGRQAAEQETLTATALWPTDTATPTSTASPTPTPSRTATSTPTPTPLPSGTVLSADKLRAGPGTIYATVLSLAGGETARPLGQTVAGDWLLLALDTGEEGWLLAANVSLDAPLVELPIITDIPPTPTLPPVTFTPTVPPPTATSTPSPYSCDLSIMWDPDRRHVILVGLNWPPSAPLTITIITTFAGVTRTDTYPTGVLTGDADDQIPNGFWYRIDGGTATYTLNTWACSATVTGP
jgi:hypothetical protein